MKFNKTVGVVVLSTALLTACSSDKIKDDFLDTDAGSTADTRSGADSGVYVDNAQVAELDLDRNRQLSAVEALMQSAQFSDPNSPLSTRTIYFEYDSSQVAPEFIAALEAHANYLMAHPNQRINLEGHSDERGTREYNISLAEQRAKSVFKILQLIGVMNNQVDVISYGEEKPAKSGHDAESLRLNRRVELVYK